uniref:Si:dkey-86e18.1 n=1 Tax=Cyprinus carpio TaxID=7962 RepID=A0A8C1SLZ0_CYPCA
MARNEEKQCGRLNRLWLQKEREEGRIKDVHVARPKLATLNSAAAVKKWMPSIKKEIEYCLQQSQLSHYPERKIDEFHQHIEKLETEYKRYLKKLRSLDPTCKHKPWEPRAYAKRRQDPCSNQNTSKKLCRHSPSGPSREEEDVNEDTNPEEAGNHRSHSNIQELPTPLAPATTRASELPDQDLPLCFDQSRLAVAVASSRVALAGQQQDTGRPNNVDMQEVMQQVRVMPFPAPLGFNHIIHLTVTALTILMQTPEIANCRIESAFTHSYAQTDVSCGSSCSLVVCEIGFTETPFLLHHCLQTLKQKSLMVR